MNYFAKTKQPQNIMTTMQPQEMETRRLVDKVLWRIMPVLFFGYIFAFLDRVNVGIAALTMRADLALTATMFGWGAGIFSLAYCLFELPSNLILHRVGARIWISRIMITWGIAAAAMAFTQGEWSFYALRFLLGMAEAGFSPGVILFMTYWVPEKNRSKALAMFLVGAPVSSIIGSPVSAYLLTLDGMGGLHGWQWLFILEAVPAIILGVLCLFILRDSPAKAPWLDEGERAHLTGLLEQEAVSKQATNNYSIGQMLLDRRILAVSFANFFFICGLFGVLFWLPQIIKGFGGVSNLEVGFLNALPYVLGAIAMVLSARHSDKTGERIWHVAIAAFVASAGLLCSALAPSLTLSMVAITVATIGIYSIMGIIFVIPTIFLVGRGAAGGIAIMGVIGNLGGFLGPYVFGFTKDITQGFTLALYLAAASLLMSGLCVLSLKSFKKV